MACHWERNGTASKTAAKTKRVIMSIGVPGSGKSTLLKPYAQALGASYISSDETRGEVTGDEADVSQDATVWPLIYQKLHDALDKHDTVVFDSTAANFEKRQDIIRHLRQKANRVEGIYFDVPLDTALSRNDGRDRQVPPDIIKAMHRSLTRNPPGDEFDSIQRIVGGEDTSRTAKVATFKVNSRLSRIAYFMDPQSKFGATYEECKFCDGSGYNADQRCANCSATGNAGTVACYWCYRPLHSFDVVHDRLSYRLGFNDGNTVPACESCQNWRLSQLTDTQIGDLAEHMFKPQEEGGGGFSVNVNTGLAPADGWMIGVDGTEASKHIHHEMDRSHVVDIMREYMLQNLDKLKEEGHHWGGWLEDHDDGTTHLVQDRSKNIMDDDEAMAFAKANGQREIYHVKTKEYRKVAKAHEKHYVRIESEDDVDSAAEAMVDKLFGRWGGFDGWKAEQSRRHEAAAKDTNKPSE